MSSPLFLREDDVQRLLQPIDAIRAIEAMCVSLAEGTALNLARRRLSMPGMVLHSMLAGDTRLGRAAWKEYSTTRSQAQFLVGLVDQSTGRLLAMIEADRLGQLRTGAVSAVAARWLLTSDQLSRHTSKPSLKVAVIGCGWQAESQVECLGELYPFANFHVFSRDEPRRNAFAARMSERLGMQLVASPSCQSCVDSAEIVVCITNSRQSLLEVEWLTQCQLLIAAGSNQPRNREIPSEAIFRAKQIVVDDRPGVEHEAGDLILAASEADDPRAFWNRVEGLPQVVQSRAKTTNLLGDDFQPEGDAHLIGVGELKTPSWSLFKSVGMAAWDLAVASVLYDHAIDAGLGRSLAL